MNEDQSFSTETRGLSLGSIRGTTIHVEISFLVLLALFVFLNMEERVPIERALLWIPIVFLGVLMHEFGHAAVIGLFGYGPSRISLSGLGGVTMNERSVSPGKEIIISAAGPLTSLAIALLASLGERSETLMRDPMMAAFIPLVAWTNRSWAIFNLLPIFPLDGGQILRNLCRLALNERRALVVSTILSLLLTAAMAFYAITHRMMFMAMLSLLFFMQNYQILNLIRKNPPDAGDAPRE
ncbi:MAG TPA: M50 family metallopeptidase [Thermoanaerobaculia bacterium]|nr:M50 family metallopeptidase [Thermoanaerobaculia bacterium]